VLTRLSTTALSEQHADHRRVRCRPRQRAPRNLLSAHSRRRAVL